MNYPNKRLNVNIGLPLQIFSLLMSLLAHHLVLKISENNKYFQLTAQLILRIEDWLIGAVFQSTHLLQISLIFLTTLN